MQISKYILVSDVKYRMYKIIELIRFTHNIKKSFSLLLYSITYWYDDFTAVQIDARVSPTVSRLTVKVAALVSLIHT